MYNDIELLAPAGSWESLVAAVQNGADAVYLGGRAFNARQFAGNFDNEQLKDAVEYCHVRGVSVYLAVNTLLNDAELMELSEYIVYAYNIGIDAVIVQDVGVAKLIKEIIPQFEMHASTQMTIHNLEGIKALEKLGFQRAVLARELNREEIEYICKNTSMEIEVFVHGALCVSYSGQCLMSSMIGGRSGNRGSCAGPCRLPYRLKEHQRDQYLLSLKDLNLLEHLQGLRNMGVKSLKLEGRMKRPEYVATVTRIYKKYLDSSQKVSEEDSQALLQVFNRGGFTQGYYKSEKGAEMVSLDRPKHWGIYLGDVSRYDRKKKRVTASITNSLHSGDGIEIWTKEGENLNTKITRLYQQGLDIGFDIRGNIQKGDKIYKIYDAKIDEQAKKSFENNTQNIKITLYGHCQVALNQPIQLSIWDDDGNYVEYTGEKIAQAALRKSISREDILKQLRKLGDTPFKLEDITVEVQSGVALSISEVNSARRKVVELLSHKRSLADREMVNAENMLDEVSNRLKDTTAIVADRKIKLSARVYHFDQAQKLVDSKIDQIIIPLSMLIQNNNSEKLKEIIKKYISRGVEVIVALPRILRQKEIEIYKKVLRQLPDYGIYGIMVGNVGLIQLIKDYNQFQIYGDFGLNILNSEAVAFLREQNIKSVMLSPELTIRQISKIRKYKELDTEVLVYGRLPLMITEHCLASECQTCGKNQIEGLRDRKGMIFPIITDSKSCRTEILNSQPTFMMDRLNDVISTGVSVIRLLFTTETPVACEKITNIYSDILGIGQAQALEKHRDSIDLLKQEGFTRGHFYRGV